MNKPAAPKITVAECTAGCMHDGKPRLLEEKEVVAHEDKHLHHKIILKELLLL